MRRISFGHSGWRLVRLLAVEAALSRLQSHRLFALNLKRQPKIRKRMIAAVNLQMEYWLEVLKGIDND